MVATDEDALVCDFAETYGVMDWRSLPVKQAATLAAGLRSDARIVQKMSGLPISTAELVQAYAADRIAYIAWSKTKDAQKGVGRPVSILKFLLGQHETDNDLTGFNTPEDFDAWRAKMIGE